MFVVEAFDLGLETGDGQMGSVTVDDLCDDVPEKNHKGEGNQCHCKGQVQRWFDLRPPVG